MPAISPSGPNATASTSAGSGSDEKITSASCASARGVSAQVAPALRWWLAAWRCRSCTTSLKPAFCRFVAMRPPMVPSPTKPTTMLLLAITLTSLSKHAQMLAQIDAVGFQRGGGRDHGDAAAIENDDIVGDVEGELWALLHQHDGKPALLESADGRHHFGDDLRRQAFRRLVHQQHARIGHQRAADGEHLLLAAGEVTGELGAALGEAREHGEDGLLGPWRVAAAGVLGARGDHQVLAYGETLEYAAALRHQRHAARRDQFRRQARHRRAEHFDGAAARRQQPDADIHAGRFAGAVAA